MTTFSRQRLLQALLQRTVIEFAEIQFIFEMPDTQIRHHASHSEQAMDLIRYAEKKQRLDDLAELLEISINNNIQSNLEQSTTLSSFNQAHQEVAQQFNVAGDMHIHGDAVTEGKVVQHVSGNHSIFSATSNARVDKK